MNERNQGNRAELGSLSRGSLNKTVLKDTLQHPLALYPFVLGILGTSAALVLGLPFEVLVASICSSVAGLTSWIVNYFFRFNSVADRHLHGQQREKEAERSRSLERLDEELTAYGSVPEAEQFAWQGKEQLTGIQKRLENLRTILGYKLDTSELTYARYRGVAEQVALSVLDNLRNVAIVLKSVQGIDVEYIRKRLQELERLKNPAEADREELATLNQRKALRDQQLQEINILLTRNEEAMTLLDTASAAVARLHTGWESTSLDLDSSLDELQQLLKIPSYQLPENR